MKKETFFLSIAILFMILLCCISVYYVFHKQTMPTISLIGEGMVTLEVEEEYEERGAIASIENIDLSNKIVTSGDIDTTKPGTYTITYDVSYKNKSNHVKRMVEVLDSISPTITLNGQKEIIIPFSSTYQDAGCTATDNVDGDLTNQVKITGKVDTKTPGEYSILYEVEDRSGNRAREVRKVTVSKEKTIPTNSLVTTSSNTTSLPVLMYHFFYDSKAGEKGKDNNWMEISDFEDQMKYLCENDFYFPSWKEVEDFIDGKITLPTKSVVVTIDDGDETFLRLAIPIIEKYHIKATSFVVTSWNGDWVVPQYRSENLTFGSHSHDMHRPGADGKGRFLTLTYEEALKDVTTSKTIIGDCTVFCYPFGHYNEKSKKVLKAAGYDLAFTTKGGRVTKGMNKYQLPRIRMSKGVSLNSFKSMVN